MLKLSRNQGLLFIDLPQAEGGVVVKNFYLLFPILLLSLVFCVSSAEAKIIFNWSEDKIISSEKRKEVEARFRKVAAKYLDSKYANLGPYDFAGSSDELTVMVMDSYEEENSAKAEFFPGIRGATLFVDPSLLESLNVFQTGALHELSHAYDYIMTDKMRNSTSFFMRVSHEVGS
ncbi:MAG: hypothetical protein AAB965_02310, partial [Patescibacteria group bacterium]